MQDGDEPLESNTTLATTVDLGAIEDPIAQRVFAFCRAQPEPVMLVGGTVRDMLLGRPTHDLDLVVARQGLALARRVADALGGAFVPIDPDRDVGRAVFQGRSSQPLVVDVAAWRAGSLEGDLRLRDFSINALAAPLRESEAAIVDVTGGLADLGQRVVRAASSRAFADDPLRMLRAVRILAELAPWGFRLDAGTAGLVRRHADSVPSCSAERVRDELVRIVASDAPDRWLRLLADLGLLAHVLPEVDALAGVTQSEPHRWDVFEHTLRATAHVAWVQAWLKGEPHLLHPFDALVAETLAPYRDPLRVHFGRRDAVELRNNGHLLRWAALYHDAGKPGTRTVQQDEGRTAARIRFIGHETRGAGLAEQALRRLRFSEDAVRRTSAVVAHHMRPLLLANEPQPPSARTIYRYFRDLGDAGIDVAVLSLSDVRATGAADADSGELLRVAGVVVRILHDFFERPEQAVTPPPLIDGNDLMAALGVPPGRLVGQLLTAVTEAQVSGEVQTAEEALDYASRLAGQRAARAA